jgi:hypothetical protein
MLVEKTLLETSTDENKTLSEQLNDENLKGLNLKLSGLRDIIRYDRDWTIDTIYKQVEKGIIDLEPEYQRRNVWNDLKKTELIESILLNYPIPKLIFMENPEKPNHFIVVDGKQRLLTIIGFINPEKFPTWDKSKLQVSDDKGLRIRKDLKDKDISFFNENTEEGALFFNASITCEIISRVTQPDLIYDIFYRLNSGAEPLTFQELRQAIFRGEFSKFLASTTSNTDTLFQKMISSVVEVKRMEDVEILLRLFAVFFFGKDYKGNLKDFLDFTTKTVNKEWLTYEQRVHETYKKINLAITNLLMVFKDMEKISRLPNSTSFNKALFEVQVYYFGFLTPNDLTKEKIANFLRYFEQDLSNAKLVEPLRLGTNSTSNFKARFELFRNIVNKGFDLNIPNNPFEK